MRVISGSAGSLRLKTLKGIETRPTSDKTKETLFNVISSMLYKSDVLDLFAGSGALGIEALSRGADSCIFIEKNPNVVNVINENLIHTKLVENSNVIKGNVITELKALKQQVFDLVFMDPPYDNNFEEPVLKILIERGLVNQNSLIIVEASNNTSFEFLNSINLQIIKEKNYKTNKHVFIELREED
ncbi:MAG: 16S rRNA (guanine(966)-N(2))-methyltransferase RsmD [Suipraeoptans sp.]